MAIATDRWTVGVAGWRHIIASPSSRAENERGGVGVADNPPTAASVFLPERVGS